jgi:hypothetical protein
MPATQNTPTHQEVIDWLSSNHSQSEFLTSVWGAWRRNGDLSPRQWQGVINWMTRRSGTTRAARWSSSVSGDPVNATYRFRNTPMGSPSTLFKIHTLTQARRPQLVGYRVVSVQNADGTWRILGYLATSGLIKVWSSISEEMDEDEDLAAIVDDVQGALGALQRGAAREYNHPTVVEGTTVCIRCNSPMSTSETLRHGMHAECHTDRTNDNPVRPTPPRVVDGNNFNTPQTNSRTGGRVGRFANGGSVATATRPVALSEVDGVWEQ